MSTATSGRAREHKVRNHLIVEAVKALHQPEWHCGNPRHTNPDAGCPECAEYCTADGEQYPCPTITTLTAALEVEG